MTILLESLWIWLGLALVIAAFGGAAYMGMQNRKALIGCSVAAAIVLGIGLYCVYFVETDYKAISKMLTQLASAIEQDDVTKVKSFIHPSATSTIIKAEDNMNRVRISSAKFFDLKVESNSFTSPPTANVKFTAVVYFKFKSGAASLLPGLSDGNDFVRVKFDVVELEKTNKSWVVTDKCDFTPSAN